MNAKKFASKIVQEGRRFLMEPVDGTMQLPVQIGIQYPKSTWNKIVKNYSLIQETGVARGIRVYRSPIAQDACLYFERFEHVR